MKQRIRNFKFSVSGLVSFAFLSAAQAAPLPAGTLLTIDGDASFMSYYNGGLDLFNIPIAPGTDGGIIIGKDQQTGGQELGSSNVSGEMTDTIDFIGFDNTVLATAPLFPVGGVSGDVSTGAASNIFDDASCSGVDCIGKTELGSFHLALEGNAIALGDCAIVTCMDISWIVNADNTYELNYAPVLTQAWQEGFYFHIEGTIVPAIPVPAALWLFGSGLIALLGIAARKKTH